MSANIAIKSQETEEPRYSPDVHHQRTEQSNGRRVSNQSGGRATYSEYNTDRSLDDAALHSSMETSSSDSQSYSAMGRWTNEAPSEQPWNQVVYFAKASVKESEETSAPLAS
ncbi:MAG: hypothetical protein M1835_002898 [Candelina submexicana]|nr:MAG: hypothetical protein M1835_002898 [Candelina submexicana]